MVVVNQRSSLAHTAPLRSYRKFPHRCCQRAKSDLFADDISLKDIRDAALYAVSEDLKHYLDEINTTKESAVNSYVAEDGPQYRVLLKHMPDFIDQIPIGASKTELDMALHRQLHQRQVKLKQEGQQILAEAAAIQDDNAEAFYRRFEKYVSDENELGKTALAQYVVHRRVIVELLEKALSLNPESGRYAFEKAVHSLMFPMRATSDDGKHPGNSVAVRARSAFLQSRADTSSPDGDCLIVHRSNQFFT